MTRSPWASRRAWRSASSALACGVSCHWVLSASTMRWCSGQRKSGMTRRPSRCRGTLTCGGVRPAALSRSWTRSSSSLRVAGGWVARTRAKRARPGRPAARSSWRARQAKVGQVHGLRAAHQPPQRHVVQRRGEVHDRPRGRGGRDAAVADDVLGMQAAGAVHADAGRCSDLPVRHDHLRAAILHGPQLEQHHRGRAAENRIRAARLDRRQPPALRGQARVADGVDAAVHAVQVPRSDPASDDRLGEPARRTAPPETPRPSSQPPTRRPAGEISSSYSGVFSPTRTSVPRAASQNSTRLQHLTRPVVPPSAPGRRGGRGGRP